jgi:hypothetical protein
MYKYFGKCILFLIKPLSLTIILLNAPLPVLIHVLYKRQLVSIHQVFMGWKWQPNLELNSLYLSNFVIIISCKCLFRWWYWTIIYDFWLILRPLTDQVCDRFTKLVKNVFCTISDLRLCAELRKSINLPGPFVKRGPEPCLGA